MLPKTELLPCVPTTPVDPAAPAPPAPTVTVYATPFSSESIDSAAAPPPLLSPDTDERYPPAPAPDPPTLDTG
jgi:hypothetical protein